VELNAYSKFYFLVRWKVAKGRDFPALFYFEDSSTDPAACAVCRWKI
jgi:hypothetical protein